MNVFISYRRSDTQDLAGRLADRLRHARGVREVFIDVEEIAPGVDFVARLREALQACDLCLVLVGHAWRGVRDTGPARMDDPADFVRLEVATALTMAGKVLPVLANGAAMPAPEVLPAGIQPLTRINAVELRHAHFDRDLDVLLDAMQGRAPPTALAKYFRRHPVLAAVLRAVVGMASGVALLTAGAALHTASTGRSLEETLGGAGPVWLLLVAALVAGGLGGVYAPWRR
jgi:hypothetical protein